MERGVLDHDAADGDRLEPRDRRQRTGTADLDVDGFENRGRLLGRKLVGNRPARAARAEAEARLQRQRVDLVDDAVDIVVEAGALLFDRRMDGKRFLDAGAQLHQPVDGKAPFAERLDHAHLRVGRHVAHLAPRIGEEPQRPRGGDLWILLTQRPGRGIARVDVERLALLRLNLVELGEVLLAEIDLAAHLDDRRHAFRQRVRNILDGADVGGDVLTADTVAPGDAEHQLARLVAQRHRQAVDLGLGGERDRLVLVAAEEAEHLGDEIAHVLVGEGVLQRQHRNGVADGGELPRRRNTDPLRRAVGPFQGGKAGLDGVVALTERVVLGIGDGRRILGVVAAVMPGNLGGKPRELSGGLRLAQIRDRLRCPCRLRHALRLPKQ